jgi:glutamate carboxypeptidase
MNDPDARARAISVDELLRTLEVLVRTESPSSDIGQAERICGVTGELGQDLLGAGPETVVADGRPHLLWSFGEPRVMLLGHLDTVWPVGSLEHHPWIVSHGRVTGAGCFDMKAGVAQMLHALASLPSPEGVSVLLTTDEEIGAPTSRALIESTARSVDAVLVLEPSAEGRLKTGRKGAGTYVLRVEGRAAHAGLEPWSGVNAGVELAHQILAVSSLGSDDRMTTVTPTVMSAGTASNVVPSTASVSIDVRAAELTEQERVDKALRALPHVVHGSRLVLEGRPTHPPMTEEMSRGLFRLAQDCARDLGLDPLDSAVVGGASDGNFTAALGIPTLDGLGAVGGGAHAADEHVVVEEMPRRAALLAALLERLRI